MSSMIGVLAAGAAVSLDNGLGDTPAMGWSSWNYFSTHISEQIVLDTAAALVATGLRDAGFE